MSKIAVVTDTDSSLPPVVAEQYGILQAPITIHFEDESYTTGVDIDDALLFEKIDQRNKLPTTAAPAPGAFAKMYEEAFSAGADAVVCLTVSGKVSATYNAAVSACEMFPGREISVVDTLNLSMGQGLMVIAAAEAALAGASKEQVIAAAMDTGQRARVYAVLSTLKYLALSGRVGKLAAGMADTLNIKPVLTVQDGKLDLLERVRTRKKALERMYELAQTSLNGNAVERAAVIHVNNPDGAREVREELARRTKFAGPVITAEFTPGLSVHAGTGVVGVVVVACQ